MTTAPHPFEPTRTQVQYPEPVPGASQLVALPFTAAIAGYLRSVGIGDRTRVVLHRAINREGGEYLQQLSAYSGIDYDSSGAGRMNAVTTGIMGKAFARQKIVRTRAYPTAEALLRDLQQDMKDIGDQRDIKTVALSYLAIPMISSTKSVPAILYADTFSINAFSDDNRLNCLVGMCEELCKLLDKLTEQSLPGIQNFELTRGAPVKDTSTVYPRLQQVLENHTTPKFTRLTSLNFEAAS
ncbi:hypothetical protein LB557_17185 [Mesorhizobium sp. BR115XR7A]|uniref:hypothetical protein n=1 Tax=Mesorhizobium sp. BR115XR7A TaxID=2876645 RepID=UPI001CCD877D|nr:hypothetical protein [Mesorhizobium sp. BR115XR7A]MBZ9907743.1 hypothetical protein [Mesorhizobium sp. BR115XR7A]MBZ9929054.1 hypothetical protein [Mesorhizobium sp. BR1-1-5]